MYASISLKISNNGENRSQPLNRIELNQFFAAIDARLVSGSISTPGKDRLEIANFFDAISTRLTCEEKRQRKLNRNAASQFNVFDLIEPDENKLSDILGDLLDPKGTHGQGDMFLRLLLERLGFGLASSLARGARVRREAATYGILKYRRRIDLLVEAGVLLAIENKVDSGEQDAQIKDYLEHLRHCTKDGKKKSVLIYLTPDQRRPDSLVSEECIEAESAGVLHCWSYRNEVRCWLEACRKECKAEKMRYFLADFIAYIESHMTYEPEEEKQVDEQ